jgi:hypothetical protein
MNITSRATTLNNKKTRAIVVSNPTVTTPYNLEYFAPSFQNTIACSQRGQYVSFCASGGIYSSSDYGYTFTTNIFNYIFTSIAISTTGQHQVCTSCGYNWGCVIYMSNDYGATWTLRRNLGPNWGRFIEKVVISSSGQYIFCSGGGNAGFENYYSTNFGTSFSPLGGITTRPTCCIFNDKVLVYNTYDRSIYSVLLSASPPVETYYRQSEFLSYTQNLICNSTGSIIIYTYRDGNAFYISIDSGFTYTLVYTPSLYQLFVTSGVIYGSSSTAIYKSIDYGASWTVVFTVPNGKTIRSMCGNITYINMVYTSGEIVIYTL